MKKTVLIALLCIILMTSSAFAGVVEDAQSDYQWKLSLVTEQTQRLDMWYAANAGGEITSGQLAYLKSDVIEFIKRENDAIESGKKYEKYLEESLNDPRTITPNVVAEIKRIEQNENIMNSDKEKTLAKYQNIENQYKERESVKKALEDSKKMNEEISKDIEETIKKVTCPSGQTYDPNQQKCIASAGDSKSTPGFEAIYLVLILLAFFCLPKKR